jgi:hypothetical protein
MEVSLDLLRDNLGDDLSQKNVERFLFRSLRREPKTDHARD